MTTTSSQPAGQTTAEIIATPGRYYRNTRYLVAIALIGIGLWSAWDGFVAWPRENAAIAQGARQPHTERDIRLNQGLALLLPTLAVALLVRCLYNSRGRYRLAGQTLHVPGHPPVPLDQIRLLDKRLWERKGIAYVEYDAPDTPKPRRLRLDDFVYDAAATRQILRRIEEHLRAAPNP